MVIAKLATGFNAGRWDHWLLIVCFAVVSSCGLWLSFQWRKERIENQTKLDLTNRLMWLVHRSPTNDRSSESDQFKQDRR